MLKYKIPQIVTLTPDTPRIFWKTDPENPFLV